MGTLQSKYQGRYKNLKNKKDVIQHHEPTGTNETETKVIGHCFAPLACTEDADDIPMSPSPSLFSMPSFDDVIRRMTSVNQNADTTDPNDYDDESIIASDFDEDSISLSWAASFNSSTDIDDRINQSSTDTFSESEQDDDDVVESRPVKQNTKKPRSICKNRIFIH
eukprot:XP_011683652.1 PREDICTED: uncharacterized protein LOC105447381 [Strongylocentrotus purpuratus]